MSELPGEVGALVRVVQGLCIYDLLAEPFYGVKLTEDRAADIHLRTPQAMLERIRELDSRPLVEPRPPEKRLAARCSGFTMLLVAFLREQGIRARARGGFGAYFNPPYFEDHWVCEYWRADEDRWALADAQFDEVWRGNLGIRHDILDVPREQFVVAGEAWRRCRAGKADPEKFGIAFVPLRGLWFVAGSLVRDAAALAGVQALPWDVWGAMPREPRALGEEEVVFFDGLADMKEEDLKGIYEKDDRIRAPATVFNAIRNRPEALAA
jgi:hypothetical protein